MISTIDPEALRAVSRRASASPAPPDAGPSSTPARPGPIPRPVVTR